MYNTPNKGWLLDKDVPYGHPCANYKNTMKLKDEFILKFGRKGLGDSTATLETESDHMFTQRVRDAAAARYYSGQNNDLKFLDSVLGFSKKSEKQMAIVHKIAKTLLLTKEATKISLKVDNIRIETGEQYISRNNSTMDQVKGELSRMGVFATDSEILDAGAMDYHFSRGMGRSMDASDLWAYQDGEDY